MKIVFAGGGTAGHVNPALAVAGPQAGQRQGLQGAFLAQNGL